jgi:hypothetical protein
MKGGSATAALLCSVGCSVCCAGGVELGDGVAADDLPAYTFLEDEDEEEEEEDEDGGLFDLKKLQVRPDQDWCHSTGHSNSNRESGGVCQNVLLIGSLPQIY